MRLLKVFWMHTWDLDDRFASRCDLTDSLQVVFQCLLRLLRRFSTLYVGNWLTLRHKLPRFHGLVVIFASWSVFVLKRFKLRLKTYLNHRLSIGFDQPITITQPCSSKRRTDRFLVIALELFPLVDLFFVIGLERFAVVLGARLVHLHPFYFELSCVFFGSFLFL